MPVESRTSGSTHTLLRRWIHSPQIHGRLCIGPAAVAWPQHWCA